MIDKLVLRCFFLGDFGHDIEELGLQLTGSYDPKTGKVTDLRHPWESIPSSFSTLAFHYFPPTENAPDPYIELKASPAKLMNGHNLWGTDDLGHAADVLLMSFAEHYPEVVRNLDPRLIEVAEADVTFHSRAGSAHEAHQFVKALSGVSYGQTKARTGYSGTVYFGKKNSRLRKLKVYVKENELTEQEKTYRKRYGDEQADEIFTPRLWDWASGLIRWEATIKHRWLTRRGFPTTLADLVTRWDSVGFWKDAFADLFSACEGEDMRLVKDADVHQALRERFKSVSPSGRVSYGAADAAYRTYRAIKSEGWAEVKALTSSSSLSRHCSMLAEVGLSRARLQQMGGHGLACEVIPMVRFLTVDFAAQAPTWASHSAA